MSLAAALIVGSAALALWTYARFAAVAPTDWRLVLGHLGLSLVIAQVLAPAAMRTVIEAWGPDAAAFTVVGVALPAFTYVFLASLWMVALAGRLLCGGVR